MIAFRAAISSLLLALLVWWAPLAQASTAGLDLVGYYYTMGSQSGGIGRYYVSSDSVTGSLTGTPIAPGVFHQEASFSGILHASTTTSYQPPSPELGPSKITLASDAYYSDGDLTIKLDQTGPLLFTDLRWTAKIITPGFESTYFDYAADPDMIKNGVDRIFSAGPHTFPLTIEPIIWTPVDSGYLGDGSTSINFTIVLTEEGHVVPIPPTLFLLISGLVGLTGLGYLQRQ